MSQNRDHYGSVNPAVNPSHYKDGKYEVIDIIEDQLGIPATQGFCLGNALKYLMRLKKKSEENAIQDAEKALWYINHWITLERKNEVQDSAGSN